MSPASGVTEADLRKLARSSASLWRTLEFEHTNRERGKVHAWIRRPFDLRVEDADGGVTIEHTGSTNTSSLFSFRGRMPPQYADAPDPSTGSATWAEVQSSPPAPTDAEVQPDGSWMQGDPMYENYQWVALLQPHELAVGGLDEGGDEAVEAAGIDVESVDKPGVLFDAFWSESRSGRATWWADLSPDDESYEPRCGCCPLLLSEVTERLEYGAAPWLSRAHDPAFVYTTRFRVALDVETGICVSVEHRDGSVTGRVFSVRILAVNEPMGDELFAES